MQAYKVKQGFVFVDAQTGLLHDDIVVAPELVAPQFEAQQHVNADVLICFATDGARRPAANIVRDMDRLQLTPQQIDNVAKAYVEFSGLALSTAARIGLTPRPALASAPVVR